MLIRSIVFQILMILWGAVIPIIYCSVFFTKNTKTADRGALSWSKFVIFLLRKLCKIDYEVRGLENLPKKGGYIIACKHQSMWETVVMHMIFHQPVYTYKKELLSIPFYGWFLSRMSGIAIDRKGKSKALKDLICNSKEYLNSGKQIILFPQGTRVPLGGLVKDYPYQAGIKALYSQLNCVVVPVALNSGKYWHRDRIKKTPGTIILEFLPAIDLKTDKKDFLPLLEKVIEEKSEELLNNS